MELPRSWVDSLADISKSASGISFKSQALYLIVYITRYLGKQLRYSTELSRAGLMEADLFWTAFDTGSLYNTLFKIAYIASSAYIVYLMVNDYKPTHDPNIDTFKVQYLLAASAGLALLLPNRFLYTPTEVRPSRSVIHIPVADCILDALDLFNMA